MSHNGHARIGEREMGRKNIRFRRSTRSRTNNSPSKRISPSSGDTTPIRHRSNVVLPAPFKPSTATISPGSMVSDTSLSAGVDPYDLETDFSEMGMIPDSQRARTPATHTDSGKCTLIAGPRTPDSLGSFPHALTTPSGAIGSERRRTPVAWKMALPIAGATATIGVSPAPAEGRSWIDQDGLESRKVAEPRHAIAGESALRISPVVKLNRFERAPRRAPSHRPLDLVLQVIGIYDCSAFKGRHRADDLQLARSAFHGNLGTCRHVASLLGSAGDADSLARFAL